VTLLLDESTVAELLTMDDALAAVAEGFAARGRGALDNLPRARLEYAAGTIRITAAVDEDRGYYGVKISSSAVFGSNAGRVFNLFEIGTGRLCAVIQGFGLGALRTGAVSGLATDLVARPDAEVLALVGTGRQARTQLEAMRRVRTIRQLRLYGRDPVRRAQFRDAVVDDGIEVVECATAREAVRGAHIVVTATSATEPVLAGGWLDAGAHVNAIGANHESRRELDSAVVARSALILTDEPAQARYEAADLIHPVAEGVIGWDDVHGIDEIIVGAVPGRRSPDEITLFESLGTAIGDVVLAGRVYEAAVESGVGVQLPDLSGQAS
jgi:ornithine cyclodeaminase/alanine dehydrogenase-like protein (mu-crystallin family)